MNLLENTLLLWTSLGTQIQRVDGLNKFITLGVDASSLFTNGVVTELRKNNLEAPKIGEEYVAAQQPRLVGGIAPNSKPAASNQNGEERFFTHDEISFAADEAWSLTVSLNWNGTPNADDIFVGNLAVQNNIGLRSASNNRFQISSKTSFSLGDGGGTNSLIGKNTILTFVTNPLNDGIIVYQEGVFKEEVSITDTAIIFSALIMGRNITRIFFGNVNLYHILSTALTAPQVLELYNTVRGIYPEIESTVIGTQEWSTRNFEAVATPEGNVIANVTEAGNVEKITGGDFESGLVGTVISWGNNIGTYELNTLNPISGLQDARIVVTDGTIFRPQINFFSENMFGRWVKLFFKYKINTGSARLRALSGCDNLDLSLIDDGSVQEINLYLKATLFGTAVGDIFFDIRSSVDMQIDNVSVEEVGWSGLADLYTWLTTRPDGGTTISAYEAYKEVAAWCYYDNLTNNGATYGKLYNWYAAALLDADMDTAGFGWRVPTDDNWKTMEMALGMSETDANLTSYRGTDEGNKLKHDGTVYWDAPSAGTNSSAFTALPAGNRATNGTFTSRGSYGRWWSSSETSATNAHWRALHSSQAGVLRNSFSKANGFSVRLFKQL